MAVILLILKIIGIILLVLLGLLLLSICLLLFVPVCYRISGAAEEETAVHIRVSWLFSLVRWQGNYQNGDFDSQLRIFGIRKRKHQTLTELEEEAVEESAVTDETTPAGESEEESDAENVHVEEEKQEEVSDAESVHVKEEKPDAKNPFARIKAFFFNGKSRLQRIGKTVTSWRTTFLDIKSMILDETNKTVLSLVLAELKYLLGHFKFRRIDTELTFSMGDPAWTGQALGVLSVMPFLYRYRCNVYPDFEAEELYIRGTFLLAGRVRIVHAVVSVVRLIKRKEVRILIKKIINRS